MRDLSCGDRTIYLDLAIRRVWCRRCDAVKQERLEFLADNPFYTKRFAYRVGRRCRASTIQDVARGRTVQCGHPAVPAHGLARIVPSPPSTTVEPDHG